MKTRVGSLVLFAVVTVWGTIGTSAVVGHAQSLRPNKDVVLYELVENAEFAVVDGPTGPVPTRRATSTLQGKANPGTPLCPEVLLNIVLPDLPFQIKDTGRCVVTAVGHSTIRLLGFPLVGAINGDLAVVLNTAETNLTDAAELVVMTGTFSGTIEVSDPDGVIIKVASGTFRPNGVIGGLVQPDLCDRFGICDAHFTGTFRLPFNGHLYKKDNGHVVPVLPDERALGDATVRLEVTFD